jgi:glycosyltransferase involved in cell wall biosynthesis
MARPQSPIMAMKAHHISVCICTFKRAELLRRLLKRLDSQRTDGLFTYSVVVADNDSLRSAEQVVAEFSSTNHLTVTYCDEPQQNIALARNKALAYAEGNFIAFIDDDEFPEDDWLCNLFKACMTYGVDGVLGPVKPHFDSAPPAWVEKGKFFERQTYSSGHELTWSQSRSGNVLFRKDILSSVHTPFRSEFDTAGEDIDFFRRMIEKGHKFVWCNEAVVFEVVPLSRCNRRYLLRRALLRGSNYPKHPTHQLTSVTKSLIAVPCYTVALPILALFGQAVLLRYLVKILDHTSRLLAYLGLRLVTQRQT